MLVISIFSYLFHLFLFLGRETVKVRKPANQRSNIYQDIELEIVASERKGEQDSWGSLV